MPNRDASPVPEPATVDRPLDLALDVDKSVRFVFSLLEDRTSLSSKELYVAILLKEQVRRRTIHDELGRRLIAVKPKFLGYKPQRHTRLIAIEIVSFQFQLTWKVAVTHDLQMQASAESRSRSINISMRYAPMLGV